jgi:hypothetical protein
MKKTVLLFKPFHLWNFVATALALYSSFHHITPALQEFTFYTPKSILAGTH